MLLGCIPNFFYSSERYLREIFTPVFTSEIGTPHLRSSIMECIYSPFITLSSLCVNSFLSSVVLAAVRNKHRRCTQLSYKSASSKRRYSEFELLSNDSRVSLSIQKVDLFSYIHKGSYTNDPTKSDRREAPLWYAKHSARSNVVC